jgi:hypothetical protein
MTVATEPARPTGSTLVRGSTDPTATASDLGSLAALLPGPLSLGAAAIHYAVMSEHFTEFWAFGVFFAGAAWFQAWWAVEYSLRSRTPLLWWLGVLGNTAFLGTWAVSRFFGLPFGPRPGELEPIGLPDVTATLLEAALVIVLLTIARRGARGSFPLDRRGGTSRLGPTLVVAAVALATTLVLIAPRPA